MASRALIQISGDDDSLVESLKEPLLQALEGRQRLYVVGVHTVGRVGEVVISISGSKRRLPLIFDRAAEPGHISRVVRDTLDRFGI